MQERVSRPEDHVSILFTDVAGNKSSYATKQDIESVGVEVGSVKVDVYKAIMTQTKWLITMQFMTLGLGLYLAKLLF
ncbi:hypothetical protein ACCX84_05410 [Pantoea trifolii]|uniref:hypothetical protein n=1 Tax=Pantoea trifolii TaxID=2968030 RepID=UPI003EDB1772